MANKEELNAMFNSVMSALEALRVAIIAEEPVEVVTEPVAAQEPELVGSLDDLIADLAADAPPAEDVNEGKAGIQPADRRSVYKIPKDNKGEWIIVEGGLKDLAPGDVFYLREANGDIVSDTDGHQVFVATSAPYMTVNENKEETSAIEIKADPRYTIETVGVSFKELA